MVFGRRKKQQSTNSTSSLFRSPQQSCLKNSQQKQNRAANPNHHVQFGPVRIREYERIIGCNPSCSNGAPIRYVRTEHSIMVRLTELLYRSIGWRYFDIETPISIQAMERNPYRKQHKVDLVLSRQERESLLIEWGFTLPEIVESIRATIRIKHQRRRTVNNARYERVWEDVVVKPASRIKRKFRNKSNKTDPHLHHHHQHMDVPVHHTVDDFHSAIESVGYIESDDGAVDVPPKLPTRYGQEATELMEDEGVFTLDQDDGVVYVDYDYQEELSSASTGFGSDGNFELLSRDTSYWELERNNSLYPKIARKPVAIVVSDEPMDDYSDATAGAYGRAPFVPPNFPFASR